MPHADLDIERSYMRRVLERVEQLRDIASTREANSTVEDGATTPLLAYLRQVSDIAKLAPDLVFARLDDEDGVTYVGKFLVRDDAGEILVVSWRSPAAERLYTATPMNPQGLARRRRYFWQEGLLVDIREELFASPVAAAFPRTVVRAEGEATLLDTIRQELNTHRTGHLEPIVQSLGIEEWESIMAPRDGVLVVTGGPGTGKTQVGLTRAVYLGYENDRPDDTILIVGPNRLFIEYISRFLPQLGANAIRQAEVGSLYEHARSSGVDESATARIKSDRRMAAVSERALWGQVRNLKEDRRISVAGVRVLLRPYQTKTELQDIVEGPRVPYNVGRDHLKSRLVGLLHDDYANGPTRRRGTGSSSDTFRQIERKSELDDVLNVMWPRVTPARLLNQLLSSKNRLARAAGDVLTSGEIALLTRSPVKSLDDVRWTDADMPLLDELYTLINGPSERYGHIVVDEAQDLTPMQERMLSHRSRDGSFTILGDLTTAIAPPRDEEWTRLGRLLSGDTADPHVERLSVCYRVPKPVVELAGSLLRRFAPNVESPRAIRDGKGAPIFERCAEVHLVSRSARSAIDQARAGVKVAVICDMSMHDAIGAELHAAGIGVGEASLEQLGEPITLLDPVSARGLEFDSVVLVEPTEIIRQSTTVEDPTLGLRLLYIAMTRCTQQLVILHSGHLPPGWGTPDDDSRVDQLEPGNSAAQAVPDPNGLGLLEIVPFVEIISEEHFRAETGNALENFAELLRRIASLPPAVQISLARLILDMAQ